MSFSWQTWLRTLVADEVKVGCDMPGSVWDRLHVFLERHRLIPADPRSRRILGHAILVAGSALGQKFKSGHLGRFSEELFEDARSEMAKRILAGGGRPALVTAPPLPTLPLTPSVERKSLADSIAGGMDEITSRLNKFTGKTKE